MGVVNKKIMASRALIIKDITNPKIKMIGPRAKGRIPLIKAFWITCPKWFSSLIYISMGWLCVGALVPLVQSLPAAAFAWLVAGGIIYTIGGIIYALKLPFFNARHKFFGSHEIFHLFVMGGSLCHYVVMFYIALM